MTGLSLTLFLLQGGWRQGFASIGCLWLLVSRALIGVFVRTWVETAWGTVGVIETNLFAFAREARGLWAAVLCVLTCGLCGLCCVASAKSVWDDALESFNIFAGWRGAFTRNAQSLELVLQPPALVVWEVC